MNFSSVEAESLFQMIRSQVKSAMKDHPGNGFENAFDRSVAKRVFGQITKGDGKKLLRKVVTDGDTFA